MAAMKKKPHKRAVGRVIGTDKEKVRQVLGTIGLTMSDEDISPYHPWEDRLIAVVNGLLQDRATTEQDAERQMLGQYKMFCYYLENKLPEIIADNPDASGKLLMAIAAHRFSTEMMLYAMRQAGLNQEEPIDLSGHKMA